jgi:hypothetical protein
MSYPDMVQSPGVYRETQRQMRNFLNSTYGHWLFDSGLHEEMEDLLGAVYTVVGMEATAEFELFDQDRCKRHRQLVHEMCALPYPERIVGKEREREIYSGSDPVARLFQEDRLFLQITEKDGRSGGALECMFAWMSNALVELDRHVNRVGRLAPMLNYAQHVTTLRMFISVSHDRIDIDYANYFPFIRQVGQNAVAGVPATCACGKPATTIALTRVQPVLPYLCCSYCAKTGILMKMVGENEPL